jgi:DNA polymerase-3 subunit beta
MKFSIPQEEFAQALNLVGRGIASRTTTPVLSGVFMDLEGNKLTLIGNNTEVAIKVVLTVNGGEDGIFVAPAKLLTDFVLNLSHDLLVIETTDTLLKIVAGKTKSDFAGILSDEYPELSFDLQPTHYVVPTKQFVDAIERVSFSASSDEARAILTGISLRVENGQMEMAATDGFRLSVEKFSSEVLDKDFAVVLGAKVLQEVGKVLREYSGENAGNIECGLSREGSQLVFKLPDGNLFMTRILEGAFPPYNKIIPKSYATRVIFKSDELLRTARTASLFARSGASILKTVIDPSGGVVRLSSATEQVGEFNGELAVKIEGSANTIAFNSRYLLEFLGKVKSPEIVFEMNGANQPGVWRLPGLAEYLHVIMPVLVD